MEDTVIHSVSNALIFFFEEKNKKIMIKLPKKAKQKIKIQFNTTQYGSQKPCRIRNKLQIHMFVAYWLSAFSTLLSELTWILEVLDL